MKPVIGIVMGSDSDLPIMAKAADFLEQIGLEYELTVISAHRTPDKFLQYMRSAKERGLKAVIGGAGGAAHLPGMAAALTTLPVIGVPIETKALGGLDSLYSIVQMPSGIPVATVAINGATNAAILAAKILAVSDEALSERLEQYTKDMAEQVEAKADKIEKIKYKAYLEQM